MQIVSLKIKTRWASKCHIQHKSFTCFWFDNLCHHFFLLFGFVPEKWLISKSKFHLTAQTTKDLKFKSCLHHGVVSFIHQSCGAHNLALISSTQAQSIDSKSGRFLIVSISRSSHRCSSTVPNQTLTINYSCNA